MIVNYKSGELREIKWPEDKGSIRKILLMKGKSKTYWAKVPLHLLHGMLQAVDLLEVVRKRVDELEKKGKEIKK